MSLEMTDIVVWAGIAALIAILICTAKRPL